MRAEPRDQQPQCDRPLHRQHEKGLVDRSCIREILEGGQKFDLGAEIPGREPSSPSAGGTLTITWAAWQTSVPPMEPN